MGVAAVARGLPADRSEHHTALRCGCAALGYSCWLCTRAPLLAAAVDGVPCPVLPSQLPGAAGCVPPARRRLLPGQLRYGDYFCTLLHREQQLPATYGQPLLLRRIVCSRLGCFADGGFAPGLVWPAGAPSRPACVLGVSCTHAMDAC